jgi:Tol biopolymer transport system component
LELHVSKQEQQLTYAPRNHQLTNANVWTPDSQWIVFDVRPSGSSFTGLTIERVNCATCEVEILYQATQGAHVGVVTASQVEPTRYAFIHGPENPDALWQYDFHHRRGVIVDDRQRGHAVNLDAMDITAPYTTGALRGGSHVHMFSPDGSRLSFTYNDHVLHERDPALDLRNVGVAVPLGEVNVSKQHPREYSGSHFCVLVSQTTASPTAGSDQINRAYEEGWIGNRGYDKDNGTHQRWALAFIGDTLDKQGNKVAEIFVVDLPDALTDYAKAGNSPLAGTDETMPAPPIGVKQRRITFTDSRRYPGLVGQPRHWLRSSPDGENIAFLMKDDDGTVQLWLVSPNGGDPYQVTRGDHDVQSAFSWSPDGRSVAFVMDNSIVSCDVISGVVTRLTEKSAVAPLPDAVVYSPDGKKIAYARQIDGYSQLFYLTIDAE